MWLESLEYSDFADGEGVDFFEDASEFYLDGVGDDLLKDVFAVDGFEVFSEVFSDFFLHGAEA